MEDVVYDPTLEAAERFFDGRTGSSHQAGGGAQNVQQQHYPASKYRSSVVEQPDGNAEYPPELYAVGPDPVPHRSFRFASAGNSSAGVHEINDDDFDYRQKRYTVEGMDGPEIRGRVLDEVIRLIDPELKGLPAVPDSVQRFVQQCMVVARIRPQTALEISEGGAYCMDISPDTTQVTVLGHAGLNRDTSYSLHKVMGPSTTQDALFDVVGLPVIEGVLYGYNGA
jgi:hypothetical protein